MVRTPSTMLPLGTPAPDFQLMNVDGREDIAQGLWRRAGAVGDLHVQPLPVRHPCGQRAGQLTSEYIGRGVAVVGINSNDASQHPADSPEQMVAEAESRGYAFPYLYDETQQVAQAYHAACTPDFFLFDRNERTRVPRATRRQPTRQRRPRNGGGSAAGADAVLAGKEPPADQKASLGCNIKWKAGNEPEYFG